jgi:cytochrome P450
MIQPTGAPSTSPREVPVPPGLPVFGNTLEMWRDTLRTFGAGWRAHGDLVRFRFLGGREAYLAVHPDQVRQVLQNPDHRYGKYPFELQRFGEVVGKGLFTSEGDFWLRQRRLLQPGFHRQRVAAFGTVMTTAAEELLAGWQRQPADTPIDLAVDLRQVVMRIVSRSLFGTDLGAETVPLARAIGVALDWVNYRLSHPFDPNDLLPLPARRRFQAALRQIEAIVDRFVEPRRRSGQPGDDLLGLLLALRDEDSGEGMTDRQLRDEILTLFLAGIETTANGLVWACYLLAQHPESARRLRAELTTALGGRLPTVADLPALPYLTMFVDESLRLYPPAWAMSRVPLVDDELGGYRIPAGRPVFLSPYFTHRHPEFWESPEGFDPERFSPQRSAGRPRFAYFPFGGGPRQCIGMPFALLEIQLVLATIAQRYRLDLLPSWEVLPEAALGLRPRGGLPVHPVPLT